jgi:serine/threonine protein kinase
MMGRRPYPGVNRREYKERVLNTVAQISAEELPEGWSPEARDIINSLLQRKEDNRLGSKGVKDVKSHPWFKDINWLDILDKRVTAPYLPTSVILC